MARPDLSAKGFRFSPTRAGSALLLLGMMALALPGANGYPSGLRGFIVPIRQGIWPSADPERAAGWLLLPDLLFVAGLALIAFAALRAGWEALRNTKLAADIGEALGPERAGGAPRRSLREVLSERRER